MIDSALPVEPYYSDNDTSSAKKAAHKSVPKSTTPGGRMEIKWEVVAETFGITPATIIAGRLKAEGLPVRVWQEGAGQALGLTVGALGTGYVAVPEEYVEQALNLLNEEVDIDPEDWQEISDYDKEN